MTILNLRKQLATAEDMVKVLNREKWQDKKAANKIMEERMKVANMKVASAKETANRAMKEAAIERAHATKAIRAERLNSQTLMKSKETHHNQSVERLKQKYHTTLAHKEKETAAVLQKHDKLLHQMDVDWIKQQSRMTEIEKERIKLQSKVWEQKKVAATKADERKTRFAKVKHAMDTEINELRSRISEVEDEVRTSQNDIKMTKAEMHRLKSSSQTRLNKLQESQEKLRELRDVLADEYTTKLEIEGQLKVEQDRVRDLEEEVQDLMEAIHNCVPRMIKKVPRKGGGLTWPRFVVEIILELLSHRTPPSCIAANILSISSLLNPNYNVVEELPATNYIRECRSVLGYITKTLAVFQLAKEKSWKQLFTDGTTRRGLDIENLVIGVMTDGGFKCITVSTSVMPEDQSAVSCKDSILHTFKEGRRLLKMWRDTTVNMFPGQTALIDDIPSPNELNIGKLHDGGSVMTDNCDKAKKERRLLSESIKEAAVQMGIAEDQIKVFELACWHHLRNVWFGAVTRAVSNELNDELQDYLVEIPPQARISTEIVEILRKVEKECSGQANYKKGHGDELHHWLNTYHPGEYFYPFARALGGSRQDLGLEGSPALYMNLRLLVPWLNDRMCIKQDNILQKCLYHLLCSVEVISMIRVLSILHVAVCIPMRWLTGNTEDLEGFDFSMLDMGAACELLEHAMVDVAETPELFLDEDFMMNIFSDLKNKVDPFADYLNYMFTEKSSHPIGGSRTQDDKVLPYDILIAELFYPVRNENRQTHNLSIRLGELIADTMLIELRDKSKNTWEYLSSCDGRYSKKTLQRMIDRKPWGL